jgi:cyclophilin family peptidyl-prolyl cis-trans isomerase
MIVRTLFALTLTAGLLSAQTGAPLTPADAELVARILLAENQRDTTPAIFAPALTHASPRIRALAQRALGRIRDPKFATRDAVPPVDPDVASPTPAADPAWRLRFRALTARSACGELGVALADSSWPVRLRATALLRPECAVAPGAVDSLTRWLDSLPSQPTRRATGNVSWHAGAAALEALARVAPERARPALARLAAHPVPQVRRAVARAARVLADTVRLQSLARDADGNVQEAAIEGLQALVGHGADDVYLETIRSPRAQVVRVAAGALAGSPRAEARARALEAYRTWVPRNIASARDARVALLLAAGKTERDDEPPRQDWSVPRDAIRLALGTDIRLRVVMDGGDHFTVKLRGDLAPIMAAEILGLVRKRYYDGLTWHRVEHDFVIQGGSPDANEYVGLPRFLRDELGTMPHPRGTVGMSTRGHDTGDAQWFVNLRDNARLRADYTIFAQVIDGIEVVDDIMEGDRISRIVIVRGPRG